MAEASQESWFFKMPPLFFRYKRVHLSSLSLATVQALLKYFRTFTGLDLMPGVVAVIQTFGDRINFHPHIHILVTEGGTAPDGTCHHICRFHDEALQALFTHEVFSLLLREKLIGLRLVEKILSWQPRRVGNISEDFFGCIFLLILRPWVDFGALYVFNLAVLSVIPLF